MGRNDVIIVDNMIDQLVQREDATSSERGEAFQRMAIEFVLGHTIPTAEDLEEGIVDGANDGGIDGFLFPLTALSLLTQARLRGPEPALNWKSGFARASIKTPSDKRRSTICIRR